MYVLWVFEHGNLHDCSVQQEKSFWSALTISSKFIFAMSILSETDRDIVIQLPREGVGYQPQESHWDYAAPKQLWRGFVIGIVWRDPEPDCLNLAGRKNHSQRRTVGPPGSLRSWKIMYSYCGSLYWDFARKPAQLGGKHIWGSQPPHYLPTWQCQLIHQVRITPAWLGQNDVQTIQWLA